MKIEKIILIIVVLTVILGAGAVFIGSNKGQITKNYKPISINMKIESPSFENERRIPVKYTCDGDDINPSLIISDMPDNAESLVLIVDDPDAPMGTWVHWVVWNIPIKEGKAEIQENSVPQGAVLGKNDFGKLEWGGPCPPSGAHRYFFKAYALSTKLNLPEGSSKRDVEEAMKGYILDSAELIGLYSRQ